ncbi:MAG: hypothetical protein LW822_07995 [Phycisphaeraceae bacterium]|nr:hypothetical protein [Phycisphaeraceae bacterium]
MQNVRPYASAIAVPLALALLAGCTIDGSKGGTSMTPTNAAPAAPVNVSVKTVTVSNNPVPAAPAPVPAPAPAPVGTSTTTVFYPTGSESGAALRFDRTAPGEVNAGGEFTYELRVTNVTRVALENVMVTETIPSNFTLVRTDPAATVAGSAGTFNIGSLAPGASKTIKVTGKAGTSGSISSCATVTYSLPICSTINVVAPALKIEKTAFGSAQGGSTETICDIVPVRLIVSNPGTGVARNVTVTSNLPAGLTTTDGKQTVDFSAGDLVAGQSKTFEFNTKAARPGSFTSTASAKGDNGLTAQSNNVSIAFRGSRFAITQVAESATLYPGRPANFTVEVRNTGDGPAKNAVVQATLPAGASLISATENGQAAGGNVSWTLGTFAAGASKTLKFTVNPGSNTTINSVSTIRGECSEAASANATVTFQGVPALLTELIDGPDPIGPGEETTFKFTVRNQSGTTGDSNLKAVITLGNGLTFVSGTGPSAVSAAGNVVTLAGIPTLAAGQELVWTVKAKNTNPVGDTRTSFSVTTDYFKNPIVGTESTNLVR